MPEGVGADGLFHGYLSVGSLLGVCRAVVIDGTCLYDGLSPALCLFQQYTSGFSVCEGDGCRLEVDADLQQR